MATDAGIQALCPILSAAAMSKPRAEASRLVGVGPASQPDGAEPEAIACQGPACMWFVKQTDEHGNVVGGQCAATAGVVVLGGLLAKLTALTAAPAAPEAK